MNLYKDWANPMNVCTYPRYSTVTTDGAPHLESTVCGKEPVTKIYKKAGESFPRCDHHGDVAADSWAVQYGYDITFVVAK